ncbi:F-box protein SKIP19-like [Vicia villosa]|uniref:F-box protein SKIP19-like n=1 Tax=Vicia villosa TaxID=3911 RepID=UPI00273C4218|nr:F-box protein SKIP19-like [Vicia villosa]
MASSSVPATKVESESTTTKPNWLELPRDVTLNILQRLGTIEIISSACQVCPLWWNICKDPCMWRTIHMSKFRYPRHKYSDVDLVKMCRYAVQKSCGQLEDIYIGFFGNDKLLEYIGHSANHLRRIRLIICEYLSDKGFIEAVKKLPLIVELDISHNIHISKDSLEVVGCCCPLLKSLTYGGNMFYNKNVEAFAIAKTMPGLCSLTISGVALDSIGVVAILNGCPLLESLDMLECVLEGDLDESLKKRCCEQIKNCIFPRQLQTGFDYYFDWTGNLL